MGPWPASCTKRAQGGIHADSPEGIPRWAPLEWTPLEWQPPPQSPEAPPQAAPAATDTQRRAGRECAAGGPSRQAAEAEDHDIHDVRDASDVQLRGDGARRSEGLR